MWFATNMGLCKFDGKNFKTFTTRDGLPTNDIWRIESTEDGKMWFFSKSKRQGYISHDSVFSFEVNNTAQQPRHFVIGKTAVQFSGNSETHYGTFKLEGNKWVMHYSTKTSEYLKKFGSFPIVLADSNHILLDPAHAVLLDKNMEKKYIFKVDELSGKVYEKQIKSIVKLFYFPEKRVYFMINHAYISVFNYNDSTFKSIYPFFTSDDFPEDGLNSYPEVQSYGNYFQISQRNNWILIDEKLNIIERKTMPGNSNSVHVFKDKFGNFWEAGHDYGVRVQPKAALTNKYLFEGKKIQTINYENGYLFVNVFDIGWFAIDPDTKEARLVLPHKGKVYDMGYHETLKIFYFYDSGYFWYGKDINHLTRVDHLVLNVLKMGLINYTAGAKAIIEKPYGFDAVNLINYIELDSTFTAINTPNKYTNQWPTRNSKALLEFKNNTYVGGDGLYRYNTKSYEIARGDHVILQASVNNIIPFNKDYMLIGTDGFGAYFYDGQEKVILIKETEGFSINKIIVDNGDIWMATGNGIHKFIADSNPLDYKLKESIYEEDGIYGNNINSIYLYKNKLLVAQDNGLVEIEILPDKYKKNITPYFISDKYYNNQTNTYSIDYGNNISLLFGVLSPPSQKHIQYFYKTNTEEKWTPTDVTTLLMGKQPPGEYTVSFMAMDQHGNSGQTNIKLIILPLWYQTIFAKIGLILCILLIVILLTLYFRRRADKKQKAELELNKAMAELELKALRSQMNPHFVFNSLNAIQYFIIKNKIDLSEEYLAKFSRLVRLFFEYSRHESLKIAQEVDLLNRYLEIEKLRFEDKLEYIIEVDPEIDPDETEIPSMILQPIIENAVNHGIFHKKGGGRIHLSFKKIGPSTLLISAEDDGVGILAMKEIQKETYGNYRSKSSEVLRERLKILTENKASKWIVEYKIIDISQIVPNKTGTLVEITLQFKEDLL